MRRLVSLYRRGLLIFLAALGVSLIAAPRCLAQELFTPEGVRVLENKSFDDSEAARREILELYRDLRVTDVCDGMDLIGLQDVGLMDNSIRPLWRDTEHFTHRFVGFAITIRYVPSDVRVGRGSNQFRASATMYRGDDAIDWPNGLGLNPRCER